jgi:hypothetical protein
MERGRIEKQKGYYSSRKSALFHHRKPEKYRERQKLSSKMGSGLDI